MAINFNWTPDQVNRLPPDFIDELNERIAAENKYHEKQADKLKRRS